MNTTLNNNNTLLAKSTSFITVILKGLGQIMLQENSITGLLFLIGIFYGSLAMGFAALLATICGTAIAYLLKYDKTEINQGLYGFSAALVGVAVMLFLKPVLWAWVIVVIGAVLAAMLQHFFIKRKFPAFTFPFVLVTWLILLVCNSFFTDLLATPALAVEHISDSLSDGFKSFGQVIFQSSLLSGLLFFLAVFISSPISALYGLAAAIISAIMAYYFSIPINEINLGLYGFNAVLCAIIFAGTKVKDGVWVLISLVLSLAISLLMLKIGITKLTFPFVLATWITLFLKSRLSFEK
ncbi:MAG: urea transporter [Petrimonas sp.]|jgi:urea transporter